MSVGALNSPHFHTHKHGIHRVSVARAGRTTRIDAEAELSHVLVRMRRLSHCAHAHMFVHGRVVVSRVGVLVTSHGRAARESYVLLAQLATGNERKRMLRVYAA